MSAGSAAAPSHAELREEYRQIPGNLLTQWLVALAGSLTVAGAAPDSSCTTVVVGLTGFPFQPLCTNAPSGHLEARAVYLMARCIAFKRWLTRGSGQHGCCRSELARMILIPCKEHPGKPGTTNSYSRYSCSSLSGSSRKLPYDGASSSCTIVVVTGPAACRPRGSGNNAVAASSSAINTRRRASGTSCQ